MLSRNESRLAQVHGARVASGALVDDAAQRQAVHRLDGLAQQLQAKSGKRGWLERFLPGKQKTQERSGIYLMGKVGRGKTMLMDMFFHCVEGMPKTRMHFNAFMEDVHTRLFALRQGQKAGQAVAEVAKAIGGTTKLLCLDEFQVNDIADAMLIGRLFKALIAEGVFIVLSSNFAPERLYENGLNRQLFLPFIALIKARFEQIEVKGTTDYRLKRLTGEEVFVWPLGLDADRHLQRLWEMLTDGAKGEPMDILIKGRILHVPRAARGVAWFTFAALCEAPLASADYLALAKRFPTVFIERVPKLGERSDATRRFITLIDILYDAHTRVVVSAAAAPSDLAPGSLDFERTLSRLQEMQGREYWLGNT